jgi:hypothetical protein
MKYKFESQEGLVLTWDVAVQEGQPFEEEAARVVDALLVRSPKNRKQKQVVT